VDLAMGQIPRSTERISGCYYYYYFEVSLCVRLPVPELNHYWPSIIGSYESCNKIADLIIKRQFIRHRNMSVESPQGRWTAIY